ncbi:selenocysteine-specific translation elongation factor [Motilibacter deserti]|uniref:Selenocysteine-specific elongation factor n=1 Tax=Motilibacter deserti TaxID=2714956 RepID=A0ABX0GY17_9ACTN|nr:selenocysteine-specific translation elongation factor [Motilibacter deserti]
MHVIATAGHVDHGKSTLVRTLTGMEPDRWAEEKRRGMTIDLGFAWTALPSGAQVAFVDVPGHERFVPNMLAGVGPVPAAMLVVAADEGWMPQSAEHLAALDALGVRHGLLVVTRSDLADPDLARAEAMAEIAATSIGEVDVVAVSAVTGEGIPELRLALERLVQQLPPAECAAPVRLWVDRSFSVKGSGTVVTGTLPSGSLAVGDELELGPGRRRVRVRGLQSLGASHSRVDAVARVALNLRGVERDEVGRGDALVPPGAFLWSDTVDVRVGGLATPDLPTELVLHVGSAAVPVRVRPLGQDTARLAFASPLPLRIGDRALLRDPGRRAVLGGVTVLDVRPPALRRRGAAAARAAELKQLEGRPDEADELRRRGLARRAELAAMGVAVAGTPVAGDWLADPGTWRRLRAAAVEEARRYADAHPLEPGVPLDVVRQQLGLPDRILVEALAAGQLQARGGRLVVPAAGAPALPAPVAAAVQAVAADLAEAPFRAPEADRLASLGLGVRELAAAVRVGALLKVADGVYLLPDAPARAAALLAGVAQPFTLSEARQALGTTRRVAVPFLELLDRTGLTQRLPDDRRTVRKSGG